MPNLKLIPWVVGWKSMVEKWPDCSIPKGLRLLRETRELLVLIRNP